MSSLIKMAASLPKQFMGISHAHLVINSILRPTRWISSTSALLKGQRIRRADAEIAPNKVKPKKERVITRKSIKVSNAPKPLHMQELSQHFTSRRPEDDVWFLRYFPARYFTLGEAIDMHRQANRASMFNNENGIIMMNALVSMNTKKKTKFTKVYQGMTLLPHPFETNFPKPRLIVFSEDDAETEEALKRGAIFAGGSTLVQQIMNAEIDLSEENLDSCISTSTLLAEILPIKAKLPTLPNIHQGTTGLPMSEMLDKHLDGFRYQTVPHESSEPSVSWLKVPIGRLNMELSDLEENWKFWQDLVQKHYVLKDDVVIQAQCTVPPSTETFEIRLAGQDMWGQREISTKLKSSDIIESETDDVDPEEMEAES